MNRKIVVLLLLAVVVFSCGKSKPDPVSTEISDEKEANTSNLCILGAYNIDYDPSLAIPVKTSPLREAGLTWPGIYDAIQGLYYGAEIEITTIGYEPAQNDGNELSSGLITFDIRLDTENTLASFWNPNFYVFINNSEIGNYVYKAYQPDRYVDEFPSPFGSNCPNPNYLFFPDGIKHFDHEEATRRFKIRIYPENAAGGENSYPVSQGYPLDRMIIVVVGHIASPGVHVPPCTSHPFSVVDIDIDPVPDTQGAWPFQTQFQCKLMDFDWIEITDENCATGILKSPLFGVVEPPLVYSVDHWTLDLANMPAWENEVEPGQYDMRICFDVEDEFYEIINTIEVDCPVIVYEPLETEDGAGMYFVDYLSKRKGNYGLYRTTVIPSPQGSQAKHTEIYYEPGWDVQNHSITEDGAYIAFDVIRGSGLGSRSRIVIASMNMQDVVSIHELPDLFYENQVHIGYNGIYTSSIIYPAPSHPVISPDGELLVFQVDFRAQINYPAVIGGTDFDLENETRSERFVRVFGIPLISGVPQEYLIFEVRDMFQDEYHADRFQYYYDPPDDVFQRPVPREQFSCWGPSVTKCDLDYTGYVFGEANPSTPVEGVAIFVNTDIDLNGDYDNLLHAWHNVDEKYMRIVKRGSNHIGCGLYDVSGSPIHYGFYYLVDGDNKHGISSLDFNDERIYLQGLNPPINESNLCCNMATAANASNARVDQDGFVLTAEMVEMFPSYTFIMSLGEYGPSFWGDNGTCREINPANYLNLLPWIWRAKTDGHHKLTQQSAGQSPGGGVVLPGGGAPGADRRGITPSTILVDTPPEGEGSRRARVIFHGGLDVLGSSFITEYYLHSDANPHSDDGLLTETVTLNLAHDEIFDLDFGFDNSPTASPDGHAFVFTSQYLSDGDIYFVFVIPDFMEEDAEWDPDEYIPGEDPVPVWPDDIIKLRLTNDACNTGPKISGRIIP